MTFSPRCQYPDIRLLSSIDNKGTKREFKMRPLFSPDDRYSLCWHGSPMKLCYVGATANQALRRNDP